MPGFDVETETLEDVARYVDALRRNAQTAAGLTANLHRAMRSAREFHSLDEIARVAGVTRARVSQITNPKEKTP